ncbi:MAG: putative Zn-dependent protease [Symbiobacteriaceae bacterium]|jgi:Zn-dependent membrane protease YugP|nr:putative Zn-dependent protease [Symbiobacteriaceae bacterium]
MGMLYWGDPTFLLAIPVIIMVLWAQSRVKSAFNQWSEVGTRSGVTAAEVARDILDKNGLTDIPVEYVEGHLSDHYDPKAKVVRLSASTYNSRSVAAIGVAAHEVGHAIQHDHAYVPLTMRNMIFPIARIGDQLGPMIVMAGIFFAFMTRGATSPWALTLIDIGIILFSLAVGFYIVTLPVEFNASSRAVAILETGGYMTTDEVRGAKKVLNAAALTYVAAAAGAVIMLLRLLILRDRARRD